MAREREPLLEYDGETDEDLLDDLVDPTDPDDVDHLSSNDQWAFEHADRLVDRLPRTEGKDRRTEGEVFDHKTLLTLHKLLVAGVLRSLDFPLSTGKEANVFRGTTPQGGHVAVKIFRVNTSTFKHVLQYIQGDERFAGATGDKREMVNVWTQKEFRNLRRMRDAGASVPEPIRWLNNVLVMEYVGIDDGPWPTLKELGRLDREVARRFWDEVREDYVRCVHDAELVHADLSEFNILVERADDLDTARPRIIDVGQAVLRNHPMAHEFMARDVRNLTAYFRRQRVAADEADMMRQLAWGAPT